MKYLMSFFLRSGEQIDGTIEEADTLAAAVKRDLLAHLSPGVEWLTIHCFNGDMVVIPTSNIAYVALTSNIPPFDMGASSHEGDPS